MKLAEVAALTRSPRHLKRVREILLVLVRYGFGDLVYRLGRLRFFAALGRLFGRGRRGRQALETLSTERRIRLVLQDLGPTFIKFGQILANRADLVPVSLITELKELQDRVAPFPWEEVEATLTAEFERPLEQVFAEISHQPIASASIAQVHRARLLSGEEVAVKVRRPNIQRTVDADLAILRALAGAVERNLPELRRFDPPALVNEFARTLRRELDLKNELYHIERFRRNFEGEARLHIPRTYPALCTPAVLTMEFLEGARITDVATLQSWGIDLKRLLHAGMETTLRSIFEHRFFHADPHPGNFFIQRDGRIGVLDFGIMGTIAEERLDHLLTFLHGALTRDVNLVITALLDMGVLEDDRVIPELKNEIEYLLGRYSGVALGELQVMGLLEALFDLFFRFKVKPPADLAMVIKTLGILEGVTREILPTFNPMDEVRSFVVPFYVDRLLDARYHAHRAAEGVAESVRMLQSLPRRLDRVLARLEAGEFQARLAPDVLRELGHQKRLLANRLTLGAFTLLVGMGTVGHLAADPSIDVLALGGVITTSVLALGTMFALFSGNRQG
jgi:ubiquinone biosynthesis protein